MLDTTSNRPDLPPEIARRRTFAIISHPDAGKTTLTEKFLLFGGAIQMAGQVRAKGEARRTRSDFMQMEKDRGISVSASAMSFDFKNFRFNLVDTPGHSDFSEDTYRTGYGTNLQPTTDGPTVQDLNEAILAIGAVPDALQPILDAEVQRFHYPVSQYPAKVKSHNLDKTPRVEGILEGIKGQYLILDSGVINLRKFTSYEIEFSAQGSDADPQNQLSLL